MFQLEEKMPLLWGKWYTLLCRVLELQIFIFSPYSLAHSSGLDIFWKVGEPRQFNFPIKDHVQLGKDLDLFDFDAAAEVFILI